MNNKLWKLFCATLYLSTFTFGGGYVIVTLLKKKFVDGYKWIDEKEMLDLVAVAQSAPGSIAINGAIGVGYKLAGIPGVIVSVLGTAIPPFVIISVISVFYKLFQSNLIVALMLEGMQAGVAAVIASVAFDMGKDVIKEKDAINDIIMIIAFVANFVFGINVIWIILTCIVTGIIRTMLSLRKEAGQ